MHFTFTDLWRFLNVFIPLKLLLTSSFINMSFHLRFYLYSHRPLLSPTVSPTLPFTSHNKYCPSSTVWYTLIIVSCTVYPQGDQCCADVPSLMTLWVHPLRQLQHVLHRLLPSRLALPRNSPLLPQPSPISSHCLVWHVFLFISTQHYSCLNKLPLAFFITPRRSRFTSLHLPLLVSILALCDDIHINSGPSALSSYSLCIYNIRSLLSIDHISVLNNLIETHHPNIIALIETWINKSSTPLNWLMQLQLATPYLVTPALQKKSHLWQNIVRWNCVPHPWLHFYNPSPTS